jgi:hypothetical protein
MMINTLIGPNDYLILTRTLRHSRTVQDQICDWLMIPNVDIMDMNIRIGTQELEHDSNV